MKGIGEFSGVKVRRMDHLHKNDKTERATGLVEEQERNQMTALRFQTGSGYQTFPATLRWEAKPK